MKVTEEQLESAIKILDEAKFLPDGATIANLDKACERWLKIFQAKEEPTLKEVETATLFTLLRESLQRPTAVVKTVKAPTHRPFKRRKRT